MFPQRSCCSLCSQPSLKPMSPWCPSPSPRTPVRAAVVALFLGIRPGVEAGEILCFPGSAPVFGKPPRAGVLERALLRSCFSSLGQPRSGLDPGWSWVGVSGPAHLGSRPSLAISVDPGSVRRSAPSLGVERLFLRLPLSAAMGVCLCPGNKKATYLSPKADAVFLIFLSQQRSFT